MWYNIFPLLHFTTTLSLLLGGIFKKNTTAGEIETQIHYTPAVMLICRVDICIAGKSIVSTLDSLTSQRNTCLLPHLCVWHVWWSFSRAIEWPCTKLKVDSYAISIYSSVHNS